MIVKLELSECMAFLSDHSIGHLGYISGRSPYIVPITYYYDQENKSILSYSALGHKINAMRSYEHVALQVEDIDSMSEWRSVLVNGRFEELKGSTAKKSLHTFAQGVQDTILRTQGEKPEFIKDFSSKLEMETLPIVFRIHIADIVGKYRTVRS
ncbi:pyridoxamine 5'-phosphate oxidase family protein [Zobellia galactanivorans]|uniref:pyridoxamine 5'-phosphate oxidase family protein n=1 Tax=Zobellia galactanivorans (strain DSM 12802 / CCUG 47099 / CIP 106680 / NCIMB 13871 / Dsij) TaxID=63186 RepID=UPI0026E3F0E5|nr:pyridoxamine 5'-phosphate oxidase family protein [Zobellia galactanivorans]MDO6807344.1 pyridoxamine 5'-phosphate oxidase family protein [Zobellia galactanivorans]